MKIAPIIAVGCVAVLGAALYKFEFSHNYSNYHLEFRDNYGWKKISLDRYGSAKFKEPTTSVLLVDKNDKLRRYGAMTVSSSDYPTFWRGRTEHDIGPFYS